MDDFEKFEEAERHDAGAAGAGTMVPAQHENVSEALPPPREPKLATSGGMVGDVDTQFEEIAAATVGTADSAALPDLSSPASAGSLPTLDDLLKKLMSLEGSDLHLKVGSPPAYRIDAMIHLAELPKLTPHDTQDFANQVMTDRARDLFEKTNEADFAYGQPSLGRFRVNCYRQRGSISIVLRAVSPGSKTFEHLALPSVLEQLCNSPRGLVLVTGGAGSGRSTTLGAMIDYINSTKRYNIVTLEDPIEILFPDKLSIVSQREIGVDTDSFLEGMRRVMRQNADVIFISEVRDQETADAALMAAESGNLVVTSMLTGDVTETITRLVEFFPPFRRTQVRALLSQVLRGVVSQRLLARIDGRGRVPATEILMNEERVANRLLDPESAGPSLLEVMAEGAYHGMQSFDQSLLRLHEQNLISFQDALAHATDPTDFKMAAHALGLGNS